MGVFDLRGTVEVGVTIILELVYMAFYTCIYFIIRKSKE